MRVLSFFVFFIMKGYHISSNRSERIDCARLYKCDHPLYKRCTLYFIDGKGLAVVQQRFSEKEKVFWWGPIDPWLISDIYTQEAFMNEFTRLARDADDNGIFPTIEVRKLMYAVGLKPLKKQYWEKGFSS